MSSDKKIAAVTEAFGSDIEDDRVDLYDGKYTVVFYHSGILKALRYGKEWRDLTGDGLVLAMLQEIIRLRQAQRPEPADSDCG